MIRTCPTCGDFYADVSLLFCPADGMPLADLDPQDETLTEATRVVEEKERVLRRQTRRLMRRRIITVTTSVLITTLVVIVIAFNTYDYLMLDSAAPAVAAALTPTPTPAPGRSETPAWTPTPDTPSSLPFVPAVTPTPTPEATPTPDRIRNPVGPATPGDTSTPTPTPIADPTPVATATPKVSETPTVKETPRPPTPTPTQTPTRKNELVEPNPARPPDEPVQPSDTVPISYPSPAPQCNDGDRQRVKAELVAKYRAAWDGAIKEERYAIARRYAPSRATNPKAKVLKPVVYEVDLSGACEPVSVKATFKWRISWDVGGSLFGWCSKKLDGQKTFACRKDEAGWRCA